jgi:hypothetical protein
MRGFFHVRALELGNYSHIRRPHQPDGRGQCRRQRQ